MPLGAVPFPFGICRICRDKATGLHYGVATCEGCKGFFKRSIVKGEKFTCHFGGTCDITPKTRSHCKACRFKRCLETGMSIEGVRMGRVPKIEKDKVLEAFQDGGSNFSNHELVLQRLDGGNYKFKLNKTLTETNDTITSAIDSVSKINAPAFEVHEKDLAQERAAEDPAQESGYKASTKTDRSVSNTSTTTTENEAQSTSNTEKNVSCDTYQCSAGNEELKKKAEIHRLKDFHASCSVSTPSYFTSAKGNLYREECPFLDQTANVCIKDEMESEKCDNPFNDTYAVKAVLRDYKSVVRKPLQRYPSVEQPWPNLMAAKNEQFQEKMNFSTRNGQCFSVTVEEGFNKMVPYTCQGTLPSCKLNHISYDKEVPQRTDSIESYSEVHNISHRKNNVRESASICRDESHKRDFHKRGSCTAMPLTSTDSQGRSYDSDEHNQARRNSFSPALINALLEQVLDSNEAVHVIAEKIQQKQQQGNFSESCAQSLCQHISEVSAKRRRVSENDFSGHCRVKQNLNSADSHTSHTGIDNVRNPPADFTNFQPIDNALYKNHGRFTTGPLSGSSKNEILREGMLVSSGIVSSSLISEKDETKIQEIKKTLNGIVIGMKIMYRLKPEHREKIRQFKQGKLHIRATTDSEEEVKETYKKIINSIPNLNELILGFCNSVPGFSDITKKDRDVLMKRAYYDIWMLCYSEYMQGDKSYMLLNTGEFYSQKTMRKILNDDMVDKIFLFANQFNSLELTDMETAILCAIRLTYTDGLEVLDKSKIAKLHSHLLDVFAFEMETNHQTTHARKLIDAFRLMPLLEVVNRIQREIIAKYSVEDTG